MIARSSVFLACILLCGLLQANAQAGNPYQYIFPVVDSVETEAGMPVHIPVFLENRGMNHVILTTTVSGDPEFSVDSLSHIITLNPGMMDVAVVTFSSLAQGTYTTLLTVTDGTLSDTLRLTAVVNPPPGPFLLLPPYHDIMTDIGVPTQIPVTIRNLTGNAFTVTVSVSGDSEFSYNGNQTISLAANGAETVFVDFLCAVEGSFGAKLEVSDGTYTGYSFMSVYAMNRPYEWIVPFQDEFEARAGEQTPIPIFLQNTSGTPVTLNVALTGDPEFTLDPANSQITVDQGEDIMISFLSNVTGVYSTLLTVTDGVDTDSLQLKVNVTPGPGNFALFPEHMDYQVQEQESLRTQILVQSFSSTSRNLSISLSGDPKFSYSGSNPVTLPGHDKVILDVDFAGAAKGVYSAMLQISDGAETDSAYITVHVGDSHTGGPLFTLQYKGKDVFFPFEASKGASVTKDMTITNISDGPITLQLTLFSDSSFSISTNTVTLDSAASATVQVTFENRFGGQGSGMLVIDGGLQVDHIFLAGFTSLRSDYDGLLVMNELDFGMVDTASQLCLDVLLENTTAAPIAISNIQLSGFSTDFSLPDASGFTIAAGHTETIPVCFKPSVVNQVLTEVLTFTFDNPASSPTTQTASVDLTGRATTGILPPWIDSCVIVGWYVNTISAPIDGSADADIELFNIGTKSITLENAVWHDGNSSGIFSLLTPLPITIPPHDPSIPGSGKTTISVRYAPTSQSSTLGGEDVATLRFESNGGGIPAPARFYLTMIGIPVQPAPSSSTIALFPKDGRIPQIDLSKMDIHSTQTLRFENNLQVPVTISGCELASIQRVEFVDELILPRTLYPGETLDVSLRTKILSHQRNSDALIMHGSHEHLHSRYDLLTGTSITGIDELPIAAEQFSIGVSPNPSAGPVHITLSAPLETGQVQVLDMLGRVVAEFRSMTARDILWNGITNAGLRADAGTYYVRASGVTTDGQIVQAVRKLVLLP
ncbi:MAG: hypothetical protein JXA28_03375 [Bacteroidetes bacterium]|nr:hypothetical protein [Bacteroidota bacterium]